MVISGEYLKQQVQEKAKKVREWVAKGKPQQAEQLSKEVVHLSTALVTGQSWVTMTSGERVYIHAGGLRGGMRVRVEEISPAASERAEAPEFNFSPIDKIRNSLREMVDKIRSTREGVLIEAFRKIFDVDVLEAISQSLPREFSSELFKNLKEISKSCLALTTWIESESHDIGQLLNQSEIENIQSMNHLIQENLTVINKLNDTRIELWLALLKHRDTKALRDEFIKYIDLGQIDLLFEHTQKLREAGHEGILRYTSVLEIFLNRQRYDLMIRYSNEFGEDPKTQLICFLLDNVLKKGDFLTGVLPNLNLELGWTVELKQAFYNTCMERFLCNQNPDCYEKVAFELQKPAYQDYTQDLSVSVKAQHRALLFETYYQSNDTHRAIIKKAQKIVVVVGIAKIGKSAMLHSLILGPEVLSRAARRREIISSGSIEASHTPVFFIDPVAPNRVIESYLHADQTGFFEISWNLRDANANNRT